MDNSLLSRHRAVGEVAAAVGGRCAYRDQVLRLEPEPRLEARARARPGVEEEDQARARCLHRLRLVLAAKFKVVVLVFVLLLLTPDIHLRGKFRFTSTKFLCPREQNAKCAQTFRYPSLQRSVSNDGMLNFSKSSMTLSRFCSSCMP